MSSAYSKRRIRLGKAPRDIETLLVDPPPLPSANPRVDATVPAPARAKPLAWVGVGALVPLGLVGSYLGLREAMAPHDGVLLRREGLAGIYVIEQNGQKFLVNSLGGLQKLDPPAPVAVASVTQAVSTSPLGLPAEAPDEGPPAALPAPARRSAAAVQLDQYRQYLHASALRAEEVLRPGPEPAPIPPVPAVASGSPATGPGPLRPPDKPAEQHPERLQAAWAGLLAAENAIHPENVCLADAVARPEFSSAAVTTPRDNAPSVGPHVDNVGDTVPVDDGQRTAFTPPLTWVPAPSPEALPTPPRAGNTADAPSTPKRPAHAVVKHKVAPEEKRPNVWQMLGKALGMDKQPPASDSAKAGHAAEGKTRNAATTGKTGSAGSLEKAL